VLGLSISASSIHAVLIERNTIAWAGRAEYTGLPDLAEGLARLAGESGRPVRRVRAVLERETVQLRSLVPAPPLKRGAVRRYVALEVPRLFRSSDVPLVTDACLVSAGADQLALWGAAASEPLVQAVLEGCAEAGLAVESLGPAADVLPWALTAPLGNAVVVYPNGGTSEVLCVGPNGTWRSRLVASTIAAEPVWVSGLASLGADAKHFAPAYAAAIVPARLQLLPAHTRVARERAGRQRSITVATVGLALLLLALLLHVGRLLFALRAATAFLSANAAVLDTALAARREMATGRATLEIIANARQQRSRHLAVLAGLTSALGDSVFLVSLRLAPDGTIRLSGYAPSASRVLANLERVQELAEPKLEGPVTREAGPSGELDRFAIVARRERRP
jgi:Tfp pilus assembly protein PilN